MQAPQHGPPSFWPPAAGILHDGADATSALHETSVSPPKFLYRNGNPNGLAVGGGAAGAREWRQGHEGSPWTGPAPSQQGLQSHREKAAACTPKEASLTHGHATSLVSDPGPRSVAG